MTVQYVDFRTVARNATSKNPRRIYLSSKRDRLTASIWLRNARIQARFLGVTGYDRHLLMAAVHAHLGGDDYIACQLSNAALD